MVRRQKGAPEFDDLFYFPFFLRLFTCQCDVEFLFPVVCASKKLFFPFLFELEVSLKVAVLLHRL